MEGEGDSRVHFSDVGDAWSSSRHVAVLQSLDAVEKKLVSALRTAATAITYLAPRASADESSAIAFNAACTEFLQLVKDVHTELAGHIHLVSDYRVYGRSTYGADKDVDITREKVKVVSEQLQALSRFLEEHYVADDAAAAQ